MKSAGEAVSRILYAANGVEISLNTKRRAAIIPLGLRLLDRLDAAYPRVDAANRLRFA